MNLYQLPEPLPVRVVGREGWGGPTGTALAIGWMQHHLEHSLLWLVFMDSTGQPWEVPNECIRARSNLSLWRNAPEKIAAPSPGEVPRAGA